MRANEIQALIDRIPIGFSTGAFEERRYGISKSVHHAGKSCKIYAEELGGTNFISLNFYQTKKRQFLKPCEMPEAKVLQFLRDVVIEVSRNALRPDP